MKKKHVRLIIVLLLVDQFTKFIADMTLSYKDELPIFGKTIYLINAQNYGTAFGIVEGHMLSVFIITILSLILLVSFYHHTKATDKLTVYGILCMMAGLLGNLMDRIFLQYVRDFIGISMFGGGLIMNLADVVLWTGLFMILYSEIKEFYAKNKQKKSEA